MVAILFLSVLTLVVVPICMVYASFHTPTSILASVFMMFGDVVVEDTGSVEGLDVVSVRFPIGASLNR